MAAFPAASYGCTEPCDGEPGATLEPAAALRYNSVRVNLRAFRMSNIFCLIDDKHVPMYRVLWVSDIPHFCGHDDCQYEGRYEVRLEMDESVWATRNERDEVLQAIEGWAGGRESMDEDWK